MILTIQLTGTVIFLTPFPFVIYCIFCKLSVLLVVFTVWFLSCRNLLAFIYIPVIQKEMNIFRETVSNSHRVRHQRDAQMPKGIPNHLYSFPEQYGAEDCGT